MLYIINKVNNTINIVLLIFGFVILKFLNLCCRVLYKESKAAHIKWTNPNQPYVVFKLHWLGVELCMFGAIR